MRSATGRGTSFFCGARAINCRMSPMERSFKIVDEYIPLYL